MIMHISQSKDSDLNNNIEVLSLYLLTAEVEHAVMSRMLLSKQVKEYEFVPQKEFTL